MFRVDLFTHVLHFPLQYFVRESINPNVYDLPLIQGSGPES